MNLNQGQLGYAFELERRNQLEIEGNDPMRMREQFKDSFPTFNLTADPLGAIDILNQGNQGACQGHALATIFQICYFLATGRKESFSRAAAYYLSQRFDGIRTDSGSTLSGGQKVATSGLCLEKYWPYPSRYDNREPSGLSYPFKLKVTRPLRTVKEVTDWIDSRLPIQTGVPWNQSCQREVVDNYQALPGSGGHSTVFWLRSQAGNIKMPNSWGRDWCNDGVNEWTESSIDRVLRSRFTVLIGYAPDEMSFPEPTPLN